MEHKGTFLIGIEVEGEFHKEFLLQEERFKHKLEVFTDHTIAREALVDPAFMAAAVLAKRLTVTGIARVTPEMVLDLFPEDGNELGMAGATIVQRRRDFRSSAGGEGEQGDGDRPGEDRVRPDQHHGDEPGGADSPAPGAQQAGEETQE